MLVTQTVQNVAVLTKNQNQLVAQYSF